MSSPHTLNYHHQESDTPFAKSLMTIINNSFNGHITNAPKSSRFLPHAINNNLPQYNSKSSPLQLTTFSPSHHPCHAAFLIFLNTCAPYPLLAKDTLCLQTEQIFLPISSHTSHLSHTLHLSTSYRTPQAYSRLSNFTPLTFASITPPSQSMASQHALILPTDRH